MVGYGGDTTFDDVMEPRPGKSDWGIDTLQRKMKGRQPLLAAFLATLVQGATYSYNGQLYYLQTWEPDDDNVFPTVSLNFKGLNSGIPNPSASDETGIQTSSMGHTFSPAYNTGIPDANGNSSVTSATIDIEFYSPQTTWRYIRNGRPTFATYNTIANGREPSILRAVITDSLNRRYAGNAPVGLVSALTIPVSNKIIGPHADPIYGTPYFECQDVVQRGYWP